MKQVLIDQGDGRVFVEEVPPPILSDGGVLVAVTNSVISSGTELSKVQMGERSLLAKARSRPDLVRKVVDNARREGLRATADVVRERLATPQPLGYSLSGTVLEVGKDVSGVRPGDLVACGGAGYANHAEIVAVPATLCVPVPDGVASEEAAFATVGSIALHGIRQAALTAGELVVVAGLGLVGQLTVHLLVAYGHPVIGVDLSEEARREVASLGVRTVAPGSPELASARADAVLLTAATSSSELVAAAPTWCRDRGRVVVVGDVGLDLPRAPYYDLEVDVRFSRSYGPGRYDPAYEEHGHDYPIGYVRWTEQRNLAEVLRLLAASRLDVKSLISGRYAIDDAPAAYQALSSPGRTVALLLDYPDQTDVGREVRIAPTATSGSRTPTTDALRVDLVGAGNFASKVLLPPLAADVGVRLGSVTSASGSSAAHIAKRWGFESASSDSASVLQTAGGAAVIATRHAEHARLVALAAPNKRAVFVEKPLAVSREQLDELRRVDGHENVMVGFNRRFSPAVIDLAPHLSGRRAPANLTVRVNAGALPPDHWLMTHEEGGRIVGEVCHFVDLACALLGSEVVSVAAFGTGDDAELEDNLTTLLHHRDGSTSAVTYTASGSSRLPKEHLEVHWDGTSAAIDDFRSWTLHGRSRSAVRRVRGQDKGHKAEVAAFVAFARGETGNPVPFHQAAHVTEATFAIVRSLRTGETISVTSAEPWT